MAKYIIDIPDTGYVSEEDGQLYVPLKSTDCDVSINPAWLVTGYHCEPYTEPDREADEMWDFVNTVYGLSDEELYEIFDDGNYCDHSYQEAKAKYEAWKKRKR